MNCKIEHRHSAAEVSKKLLVPNQNDIQDNFKTDENFSLNSFVPKWPGDMGMNHRKEFCQACGFAVRFKQKLPSFSDTEESCADATEEDEVVEVQDQKHVRRPATTLLPASLGCIIVFWVSCEFLSLHPISASL
jgi:hypothetical protein